MQQIQRLQRGREREREGGGSSGDQVMRASGNNGGGGEAMRGFESDAGDVPKYHGQTD